MHDLIAGMSTSGKTTLAKKMMKQYRAKNIKIITLDPLHDPDLISLSDFHTDSNEIFLDTMYKSRQCALFIDESGSAIGRYSGPMMVVATQSRHLGHRAHFLTQRPAQLDRTIRDQTSRLFLFRVSKTDCKTLSDEYDCDEIMQARNLQQGECLFIQKFGGEPQKIDVFERK